MNKITKISQIPKKIKGEKWRYIKETKKLYAVSNKGRVFSFIKLGIALKPGLDKDGYFLFQLLIDGRFKTRKGHRLVAQAFIKNKNNSPMVNHKNNIKHDNRVENLEWCDHNENTIHAKNLGIYAASASRGEKCYNAILTEKIVLKIRGQYEVMKETTKFAQKMLAEKYNIDRRQIFKIVRRHSWKHI